jgi:hypothetical protein
MRLHGPVTVDDVLQSLVGRGPRLESDLGPKLDAAEASKPVKAKGGKDGPRTALDASNFTDDPVPVKETKDAWKAMDRAEQQVAREIGVDRCLRDFCSFSTWADFPKSFRESTKRDGLAEKLAHAQRRGTNLKPGALAVACLRKYQEWRWFPDEKGREFSRPFYSEGRAFEEVLKWLRGIEGKPMPVGEKKHRHALNDAKQVYADSLLVLDAWVKYWNSNRV